MNSAIENEVSMLVAKIKPVLIEVSEAAGRKERTEKKISIDVELIKALLSYHGMTNIHDINSLYNFRPQGVDKRTLDIAWDRYNFIKDDLEFIDEIMQYIRNIKLPIKNEMNRLITIMTEMKITVVQGIEIRSLYKGKYLRIRTENGIDLKKHFKGYY